MKIDNDKIFWDLRDKYPECSAIISEIMSYAFTHNDTINEKYLYLGEYTSKTNIPEENIKKIFKELGFDDIVCMSSPSRIDSHLVVKIDSTP